MTDRPPIRVTGLDHIVLRVADVERSLAWYQEKLGLPGMRIEQWRQGEVPFPSVRIDATTIIDFFAGDPDTLDATRPDGTLDHLCVVFEGPDLQDIADDPGFDVQRGPARVFGAQGHGHAVYVHDPDGITVELRTYR
ncbi:MAG: VOC family virulence protein [Actinomycetia bacterium]|nr:VOC family virulence protein [Actinomycetes bacterium]